MRTVTRAHTADAPTGDIPTRYQTSAALHERARQVLPGGVNSNVRLGTAPVPLFFERGEGAHLYDVDGNRYVDYALGMGPGILGHAHAGVNDAVSASLAAGQLFAGQHLGEVELAELFVDRVPCAETVRFSSSGTEAVQAALRLARGATGRNLVVKFDGHYHGWLDTVFLSMNPALGHDYGDHSLESAGQSPTPGADVVSLPWNDPAALGAFLDDRGAEVAAVIMEPIMANTSLVLPEEGYLATARRLCDEHGALLIFDEIITGFRVGAGGAQEAFGVTPDLATFGKAMANGFTISAIAGRRDILDLVATANVVHSGTYNANCVAVAAAAATLRHLDADAYAHLARQGERLMDHIRAAGDDAGVPVRVQGVGPMFNVGFSDIPITDHATYTRSDQALSSRFVRELLDLGVRPTSRGTWFLSTAHDDADIDMTAEAVTTAMGAVARGR